MTDVSDVRRLEILNQELEKFFIDEVVEGARSEESSSEEGHGEERRFRLDRGRVQQR